MDDTKLAQLSVLTTLNKMMRSSRFSICTVDDAVKVLGTMPDRRAYDILSTLHCVEWGDMPTELRDSVPKLIERCINVPAYQFQITELPTQEQRLRLASNTLRLLTREG